MEFRQLVEAIRSREIEVAGVCHDSRQVKPGYVFVCKKGERVDGHNFAGQALVAGASYIIGERPLLYENYIQVDDSQHALADLAYAFYGDHSQELKQIGVTGTNGKSTTCHLIASLLNHGGFPTATVGTLGVFFPETKLVEKTINTTPDALELARTMAMLREQGARAVAVEISSIALDQDRALGMSFGGAIFTNLTQDHLDYHKTFEAYFQAKRRLFTLPHEVGIINIDDPYGARLAAEFPEAITISTMRPATIRATDITVSHEGFKFVLDVKGEQAQIATPLAGMHNLYNLLSAFGAIIAVEEDPLEYIKGVPSLTLPRGRWEIIGYEPTVIVDYAHTPDGMEQVLSHAKRIARGRVITLFGCTGNRDREKRPLMGEIASRYSEYVVLTNDNPEDEDPEQIARETLRGINKPYLLQLDREKAIEAAINLARPSDVVLVLGKGHEDTIVIGKTAIPFSDAAVARRYWERRVGKA